MYWSVEVDVCCGFIEAATDLDATPRWGAKGRPPSSRAQSRRPARPRRRRESARRSATARMSATPRSWVHVLASIARARNAQSASRILLILCHDPGSRVPGPLMPSTRVGCTLLASVVTAETTTDAVACAERSATHGCSCLEPTRGCYCRRGLPRGSLQASSRRAI